MNLRPSKGCIGVLLAMVSFAATCLGVDLRNRSTSSTGQFVIYCDDRGFRSRVVGFVEANKSELLTILGTNDDWKIPIVIVIEPAIEADRAVPFVTKLVSTVGGLKIELTVRIDEHSGRFSLQRQIVRALLLELAYRHRPEIRGGERYAEPPWWLVEGALQSIRNRNGIHERDVFKSIVNTEKLPSLDKILTQPPLDLESAAGAVDRACALALFEALLKLPNGQANLVRFIQGWPAAGGDATTLLVEHFPMLGDSPQSLAKWWTLQVAALGRSQEWNGLSPVESDAELSKLLQFEITSGKPPQKEKFALTDFERFVKMPAARPVLQLARVQLATASSRSHVIYRPIFAEYEEILSLLSQGKTKGIAERIAEAQQLRRSVLSKFERITDYVNWYEATQSPIPTGQFERYLRVAESFRKRPAESAQADPRLSEYLDAIEREFAPLQPPTAQPKPPVPNMIPGLELGDEGVPEALPR